MTDTLDDGTELPTCCRHAYDAGKAVEQEHVKWCIEQHILHPAAMVEHNADCAYCKLKRAGREEELKRNAQLSPDRIQAERIAALEAENARLRDVLYKAYVSAQKAYDEATAPADKAYEEAKKKCKDDGVR